MGSKNHITIPQKLGVSQGNYYCQPLYLIIFHSHQAIDIILKKQDNTIEFTLDRRTVTSSYPFQAA